MRVIVTRPRHEAQRWVQALRGHGFDALAVPLIEIHPVSDNRAVVAAWQSVLRFQAVMFVSAAAVDHFFAARPAGATLGATQDGPRSWATGPGTVAALVRHGVLPQRIDAPPPDSGQFDSEALWSRVGANVCAGWQVLLVRGAGHDVGMQTEPFGQDLVGEPGGEPGNGQGVGPEGGPGEERGGKQGIEKGQGRDWLAEQLMRAGAQVRFVVAYWRAAPGGPAIARLLRDNAVGDDAVWLFTSGQAVAHLRTSLPTHDWSRARAIASHPRIAAAARAAGFGVVRESRPALADMVASIKSLQ